MKPFSKSVSFFLLLGSPLFATTYYVSGSGRDFKSGTSPAQAFESIDHALIVCRDGDSIVVAPGWYEIGSPVGYDITIVGAGTLSTALYGRVMIDAGVAVRLEEILLADGVENRGQLMMSRCEVSGSVHDEPGAGIANYGEMTFVGGIIRDNTTRDGLGEGQPNAPQAESHGENGGGVYNAGEFHVKRTLLLRNRAGDAGYWGGGGELGGLIKQQSGRTGNGGAVFNAVEGTMTIDECLFIENAAGDGSDAYYGDAKGGNGGAVCNGGSMWVSASLFRRNLAGRAGLGSACCADLYPGWGGAIYNMTSGTLEVVNSTFTGNESKQNFGPNHAQPIANQEGGSATLVHCTSKDGFPRQNGTRFGHCLLIGGSYSSLPEEGLGPNLVVDDSDVGELGAHSGNIPGFPLLPGSLAIDAGMALVDDGQMPATDQRGAPRVVNGRVDIGAMEYQAPQTFAQWVEAHLPGGSQVAPDDDGDGDGRSNLVEFAEGSDPTVQDFCEAAVSLTPATEDPSTLAFRFQRNHAAADLRYSVQVSVDLEVWETIHSLQDAADLTLESESDLREWADESIGSVVVRIDREGPNKRFLRLVYWLRK